MPITPAKKTAFIAKVYFAVTDNPEDDVNPFTNLDDFLVAKVGDLRWGTTAEVKDRSKYRFSDNFIRVLKIYNVELAFNDARKGVKDDAGKNADVVAKWVTQAKFPNA